MDGYKIKGCSVTEDGVCAMHGIEIERRKTDRRDLENMKEEIEEKGRLIGSLLTFKNVAVGVSMLGMLVLTGSYFYTYTHVQDAGQKYGSYDADIKALSNQYNALSTRLAVVDERYLALTAKISELNNRLTELISIINRDHAARTNGTAAGASKE